MPPRILLVEDDREMAESLSAPLVSSGYEVHVARDAASAIASAKLRSPDVILLDLAVSNEEAYRLLDRSPLYDELATAPKVAMTDWNTMREKKRSVRAGVSYFLDKPVDRDQLVSVVSSILAKNSC